MDLSQIKTRQSAQDDKLSRRPSILPERRNTSAPALEQPLTMRSARRGDLGGANALMQTLGLIERAGQDVQQVAQARHAEAEQGNIARGAADEAVGQVDAAQMERSLGYRNAVTKGRTVTEFTTAAREFDQELSTIIKHQDDPNMDVRIAEVTSRAEEFFQGFAQDPETGDLRLSLRSPGALRYLAGAIQQTRAGFMANAMEQIEARFTTESYGHFGTNIEDQVVDTSRLDLNAARTLLAPGARDEDVAETALVSIFNAADALAADGRLGEAMQLMGALRGRFDQTGEPASLDPVTQAELAGIPLEVLGLDTITFSATQLARINEGYEARANQMRRQWQAKVAEEQSQNGTRLALGLFNIGGTTTRQDIIAAHEGGQIDGDTALSLLRGQEARLVHIRNEQDRQTARQDRMEARRLQQEREGEVGALVGALARGEINAAEMRFAAIQAMPHLDPSIAGDVVRDAVSIANSMETALANSAPARRHNNLWNEQVAGLSGTVARWNIPPSRRKAVMERAEADIEAGQTKFLQRVIAGEDPDTVAEEINAEIGRRHGALVRQFGIRP